MRKYPTALLAIALLGCAGQTQEQPRVFLTEEQLRALLAQETTVRFEAGGNAKGVGIYFQDGRARLNWDGGGGAPGSWRIQGDKFCTLFPTLRGGREYCSNLQKTGEKTYTLFLADGSLNGTWEVQRQQ